MVRRELRERERSTHAYFSVLNLTAPLIVDMFTRYTDCTLLSFPLHFLPFSPPSNFSTCYFTLTCLIFLGPLFPFLPPPSMHQFLSFLAPSPGEKSRAIRVSLFISFWSLTHYNVYSPLVTIIFGPPLAASVLIFAPYNSWPHFPPATITTVKTFEPIFETNDFKCVKFSLSFWLSLTFKSWLSSIEWKADRRDWRVQGENGVLFPIVSHWVSFYAVIRISGKKGRNRE